MPPAAEPAGEAGSPERQFVTWRDEDGVLRRGKVDGDAFGRFLSERHASTETVRAELRQRNRQLVPAALDQAFASFEGRVPAYADWYFAYTTRYVLMGHALGSTARHIVSNPIVSFQRRESPLRTVSGHLTDYMRAQFSERILHPDQAKADIQRKLDRAIALVQADWQRHVLAEQEAASAFLRTNVSSARQIGEETALFVSVDWDGRGVVGSLAEPAQNGPHRFKRGLIQIDVNAPLDGLLTIEHEGGEESSEETSRVIVNLFDKLAEPVVSELSNLVAGVAASGMMMGAAAAPPAAALIGLGAVVSAEVASNLLEEKLTRKNFEENLIQSIRAARRDIEASLIAALDRRVDTWVDAMNRHIAAE